MEDEIETTQNNKEQNNDKSLLKLLEEFNTKYETNLNLETSDINLSNKGIGDEGFQLLSQIPFNQINSINLSENKISDISPLTKMNLNNLIELNLSKNRINNIQILEKLNLINLQRLNFSYNKIRDIKPLTKANLINLVKLDLVDNLISDINDLEFMYCLHLENINLDINEINDISVFERVNFPQLHELEFANNYFDHELVKNHDIISNLRKKGCDVKIWGSVRQNLYKYLH